MNFPVGDWQFWVVTAIVACAAYFMLRAVVPAKFWPVKRRPRGTGATLTIGGKAMKKR